VRVLESSGTGKGRARWTPEPSLPPRALGVFGFISKTLGRSPQHRLILAGFAGVAVAISANGLAGGMLAGRRVLLFPLLAAAQLALSLFTLAGLHYLFRLPVEPRANWIFRAYEPGYSTVLLSGVEMFMLYGGVVPVTLLALIANLALAGTKGLILTLLAVPPALILLEVLLLPTYRIPFTSLYLPAQKIITVTLIKYGVGVVLYVSVLSTLVSWCTDDATRWLPCLVLMLGGYWRLRILRLEIQRVGRVEFEELPEVVVQTLSIDRD
jgi:hypothetical protein